jgi:tubulin gamma
LKINKYSIGQCGNQVGGKFWSQICAEHGINSDGTTDESYKDSVKNDLPDVFFQRNINNRFTPRAILIDLEPRVINSITSGDHHGLFNSKNIFLSPDGGGAANQWVEGYLNGKRNLESVLDMIDRELDGCDNLEGFQLVHSVAGGTGSGFGSLLLETLSDRYNKKLIQTYSVFGASEVVVQPYNTMLTLKRLIQNSDANIVFDNNSLMSIASNNLKVASPSYNDINKLISTVMSVSTNTLRFPSYSYNSLTSIVSTLIPTPDLHFIIPSYTPFTSDFVNNAAKEIHRSTTYDVILELLDKKLKMCCNGDKDEKVLAVMDIIIKFNSEMNIKTNSTVQKALIKAKSRINFAPWTPSSIHLAMGQRSSFSTMNETADIVSGLMLSNSSSILSILEDVTKQYDRLMTKNAFLNNYLKSDYENECGDIMQEFQESREIVEALIGEYKTSETLSYMEDIDDEDLDLDLDSGVNIDREEDRIDEDIDMV